MCGIVGYVGTRPAVPVLLEGLRRLEYRGYDSAGLVAVEASGLQVWKEVGRVQVVAATVPDGVEATTGVAHTRWATHGGVTHANAHPHLDGPERVAVVHNGIIDNMGVLRQRLEAEGVVFRSETDTEVIPHLIRRYYTGDPVEAVRQAMQQVRGTWGVAVAFADHPDRIVAGRNGSPLVVGLGEEGNFLASDAYALVKHTRRVIYLEDGELADITAHGVETTRLDGPAVTPTVHELEEAYGDEDLGDYPHFMLKEIHEQPESVARCIRGRVQAREGTARLGGLDLSPRDLVRVSRVVVLGCGTSYHAALVGAMAIEGLTRVPSTAEISSEFRHRNPIIDPDALYLIVSQSGETFDTLEAVREIQVKGGRCFGVVNVVGSSIARQCGAGVYIHSGPEIAVASTKAFTSQVAALMTFTLMLGRTRDLSPDLRINLATALLQAPERAAAYLAEPGDIRAAVELVKHARYVLFMGRGVSWPVALEGALKLKEIAYVPCEGQPAGEMKHGPIAMLERGTPVVAIVPADEHRDRSISSLQEVRARGARVIAVHDREDQEVREFADVSIPVPTTLPVLSPLVTVLPLQLMAYQVALELGRDIDKPRNLAKSVTVE